MNEAGGIKMIGPDRSSLDTGVVVDISLSTNGDIKNRRHFVAKAVPPKILL